MRTVKTKSAYHLNSGFTIRFYDYGNNYWYTAIVFFWRQPYCDYGLMTKAQARGVLNDFRKIPRATADDKSFWGE